MIYIYININIYMYTHRWKDTVKQLTAQPWKSPKKVHLASLSSPTIRISLCCEQPRWEILLLYSLAATARHTDSLYSYSIYSRMIQTQKRPMFEAAWQMVECQALQCRAYNCPQFCVSSLRHTWASDFGWLRTLHHKTFETLALINCVVKLIYHIHIWNIKYIPWYASMKGHS